MSEARDKLERDGASLVAEPSLPTYAADGTDLTLIRWMLAKTPAERLDVLQDFLDGIIELRHARVIDPAR